MLVSFIWPPWQLCACPLTCMEVWIWGLEESSVGYECVVWRNSFLYLGPSLQVTTCLKNDSTAPNKQHRVGDTVSSNLPKCSYCLLDLGLLSCWLKILVLQSLPLWTTLWVEFQREILIIILFCWIIIVFQSAPYHIFFSFSKKLSAWKFPDTLCMCACVEVGVRATGAE